MRNNVCYKCFGSFDVDDDEDANDDFEQDIDTEQNIGMNRNRSYTSSSIAGRNYYVTNTDTDSESLTDGGNDNDNNDEFIIDQELTNVRNQTLSNVYVPMYIRGRITTSTSEMTTECAICLTGYNVSDTIVQLHCHPLHVFHVKCLSQWNETTCPLCRQTVTAERSNNPHAASIRP
jgi:hypothetical protein